MLNNSNIFKDFLLDFKKKSQKLTPLKKALLFSVLHEKLPSTLVSTVKDFFFKNHTLFLVCNSTVAAFELNSFYSQKLALCLKRKKLMNESEIIKITIDHS